MTDAPGEAPTARHGAREAVDPRVAVVVGAGAVGTFLGGTLAASGWDVTLLARRGGGDGTKTDLSIEGPEDRRVTASVRRVNQPELAPAAPDVVILAVKMFDLAGALEVAARWPDTPLITAQNGVGAEAAASAVRSSPLIACSLTTAVEPTPDGAQAASASRRSEATRRPSATSSRTPSPTGACPRWRARTPTP